MGVKLILVVILCSIFLLGASSKRVKKTIKMSQLAENEPKFFTRFDFGIGSSNITIKHKRIDVQNTQFTQMKVGLLIDENYQQFKKETLCIQKQKLFKQVQKIRFFDSKHGTQIVRIQQNVRQHLWFVYIYSCEPVNFVGDQSIQFQATLYNIDSHMGQDESLMWPYALLMALWVLIIIKYLFAPFLKTLGDNKVSTPEMVLYTGYCLQGLATFYKIINLVTLNSSGQAIVIFDILHGAIKAMAEALLLCIVVGISWGWSLTYLGYQYKFIVAGIGVTILNIICLTLWHLSQQIEQTHHQYTEPAGIVVFIIRVIICLIFILGCLTVSSQSVGKRKYFIKKFGKYGIIYLAAWPAAVVVCQLFLPKYLQNQIIIITEQYVHLIMNAYICRLFVNPESQYQKVTLKQKHEQDSILPEYSHKKRYK